MNNEQDILRRAQQGDSEAFRLLVEAYQTQVYRLALRMCGEAAADDVTQEAFLAAWRALPEFRGTCRFSTWLYRLTTNAAIDWLRREKRHRGMDAETPGQLLDGGGMRDDGIVGGRTTGGKAEGRSGPQEERTQRSHGAISFHRGK